MKIRTDYVTNSSSSSFICEICNRAESTYDGSINDVDMIECDNGHIMCKSEVENYIAYKLKLSIKETKDILKDYSNKKDEYDVWYDPDDVDRWIQDEDQCLNLERIDKVPAQLCPICNRDQVSDYDYLDFLIKTTGIRKSDFKKYSDENFSSYKELKEFMKDL